MNHKRMRHSGMSPWMLGVGLLGLLSACGSPGVPSGAPPPPAAADASPALLAQSWLDAPRVPAPGGVHQAAYASATVDATQSVLMALLTRPGEPSNAGFEMDSCPIYTRWTLSLDARTLTRQLDCNGVTQTAVLHRASPSSYLGYYSTREASGAVSFGPFRMSRRDPSQTGVSGEWLAQWAAMPQTRESASIGITADGRQVGWCTTTAQYRFLDAETQLQRLGLCGGGASAASTNRVNASNQYTGFHVSFDGSDAPTGLGGFALRRPGTPGLAGTWPVAWSNAPLVGAAKEALTFSAQGVENCSQWMLSEDRSTLLRDFASCGNSEGVAELHRLPGTNTFAGYFSHFDTVAGKLAMGPIQIKLTQGLPSVQPAVGLRLTPSGLTLPTSGSQASVRISGVDAAGFAGSLPGDLDWSLSDPSQASLSVVGSVATVIAKVNAGYLELRVRSKINPNLTPVRIPILIAQRQSEVVAIPDSQVVFPPTTALPDGQSFASYPFSGITVNAGVPSFGGFSADELANRFAYSASTGLVSSPTVMRLPAPAVGQKVVALEGALIAGVVREVTVRGNFALLTLERVRAEDLYTSLRVAPPSDIWPPQLGAGNLSAQSTEFSQPGILKAQGLASLGKLKPECKGSVNSPATVDLKNIAIPDINPIFSFSNDVNPRLVVGISVSGAFYAEPSVTVTGVGSASLTCVVDSPLIPIPLNGHLALILTPGVKISVTLNANVAVTSPDAVGTGTLAYAINIPVNGQQAIQLDTVTGLSQAAGNSPIRANANQPISPLGEGLQGRRGIEDPAFRALINLSLEPKTTTVVGASPVAGLIDGWADALSPYVKGALGQNLIKGIKAIEFIDVATLVMGRKLDLNWNTTGWEYDLAATAKVTSNSDLRGSATGSLKFKSNAINKLADLVSKRLAQFGVGVTPPPLEWAIFPDDWSMNVGTLMRAPAQGTIPQVNGKDATGVVEVGIGQPFNVKLFNTFKKVGFLNLDPPLTYAKLFYRDGASITALGANLSATGQDGYAGSATLDAAFCRKYATGTTLYAIGFVKLGALEMPGYMGSISVRCKESGYFVLNGVNFNPDDTSNVAIVGKEGCGNPLQKQVFFVDVEGFMTPLDGWTIQSATVGSSDGRTLASFPGASSRRVGNTVLVSTPTPFSYDPMSGVSFAVGDHTLAYSATLTNGSGQTRTSTFSRKIAFRAKPACDLPTAQLPPTGHTVFDNLQALCGVRGVFNGPVPSEVSVGACNLSGMQADVRKYGGVGYWMKYVYLDRTDYILPAEPTRMSCSSTSTWSVTQDLKTVGFEPNGVAVDSLQNWSEDNIGRTQAKSYWIKFGTIVGVPGFSSYSRWSRNARRNGVLVPWDEYRSITAVKVLIAEDRAKLDALEAHCPVK